MFGRTVSDEISLDIASTPGVSKLLTTLAIWMVAVNPATKIPMGLKMLNDLCEIALGIYPRRNPTLPGSRMQTPVSSRPGSPEGGNKSTDDLSVVREDDGDGESDVESDQEVVARWKREERRKTVWRFISRTAIVCGLIFLSSTHLSLRIYPGSRVLNFCCDCFPVIFPSFEALLAFMGSAPAFIISAILPLLGKKFLYAGEKDRGVTGWESVLDWCLIGLAAVGAVGGVAGVLF